MVQLMPLPPHHLFIKIQIWFNLSGASLSGCTGKEAIKRVFVSLFDW